MSETCAPAGFYDNRASCLVCRQVVGFYPNSNRLCKHKVMGRRYVWCGGLGVYWVEKRAVMVKAASPGKPVKEWLPDPPPRDA